MLIIGWRKNKNHKLHFLVWGESLYCFFQRHRLLILQKLSFFFFCYVLPFDRIQCKRKHSQCMRWFSKNFSYRNQMGMFFFAARVVSCAILWVSFMEPKEQKNKKCNIGYYLRNCNLRYKKKWCNMLSNYQYYLCFLRRLFKFDFSLPLHDITFSFFFLLLCHIHRRSIHFKQEITSFLFFQTIYYDL